MPMKQVVIVLYDDVQLMDVAGPAEVLSVANALSETPLYELHYFSIYEQQSVKTSAGTNLSCRPISEFSLEKIDLLIIPGGHNFVVLQRLADEHFMQQIARLCALADIKASICMGSFFLGELGLLDGHKVTTHWDGVHILKQRYPAAQVQDNILYVNEGSIWTSAGIMSGVDMLLAFVVKDAGKSLALAVARILVVYLFREGGQAQFSAPINYQTRAPDAGLMSLISWLEHNLHKQLSVDQMAEAMHISIRNLHRKCQQAFDMTPAQLLIELRLERSRNLLEHSDAPVKSIAVECGFRQSGSYSRAFRQRYAISPSEYRSRFIGRVEQS